MVETPLQEEPLLKFLPEEEEIVVVKEEEIVVVKAQSELLLKLYFCFSHVSEFC